MARNYWLVKQEPGTYAWATLVREQVTAWTGVRSFAARMHLRGMQVGDHVLFYHSGDEKQVVGLARVVKAPYPDPTATEGEWTAVDLAPVKPLRQPVTLAQIKADAALKTMELVRQSRLSVTPVSAAQFTRLLQLGET